MHETNGRMSQRQEVELVLDMARFRRLRAQEFASRREVVEK